MALTPTYTPISSNCGFTYRLYTDSVGVQIDWDRAEFRSVQFRVQFPVWMHSPTGRPRNERARPRLGGGGGVRCQEYEDDPGADEAGQRSLLPARRDYGPGCPRGLRDLPGRHPAPRRPPRTPGPNRRPPRPMHPARPAGTAGRPSRNLRALHTGRRPGLGVELTELPTIHVDYYREPNQP